MKYRTTDLRITGREEALTPKALMAQYPVSDQASHDVFFSRVELAQTIHMQDPRLMLVVGPCSIHDPKAGIEYANLLAEQAKQYAEDLIIVMRVYFEKPRTTVGWKGLINDPRLDGSYEINEGLQIARQLLIDIIELELPTGTEYLDPIIPQYIGDLVSWGAIGARTTESQIHRQLASGLSCPVGFKNSTEGSIQVAVDAVNSANSPHIFLGVTEEARAAIFSTSGNEDCHIILRGGGGNTNYDAAAIQTALELLQKGKQTTGIMVDMSHANSNKSYQNQMNVCASLCQQITDGNRYIIGAMIESNLIAGQQKLESGQKLVFGQSITDACLGWNDTLDCFDQLAKAVRARKAG